MPTPAPLLPSSQCAEGGTQDFLHVNTELHVSLLHVSTELFWAACSLVMLYCYKAIYLMCLRCPRPALTPLSPLTLGVWASAM